MAKVSIALEFENVESAIAALGKLAGIAPVQVAVAQPVVAVAEKPARRGRSDAGQPRGPHKQNAGAGTVASSTVGVSAEKGAGAGDPVASDGSPVTSTAAALAPQTAAPEQTAKTPEHIAQPPAAAASAAKAPTAEEVQATVEKLFNKKGFDDCLALLSRFGVTRGKDLKEEQRADFIKRAEGVLAGEAI